MFFIKLTILVLEYENKVSRYVFENRDILH
jgi:hypothetical protein